MRATSSRSRYGLHHVEQDDVGLDLGEPSEGFTAVAGDGHGEAFPGEAEGEGLGEAGLVLDDEDGMLTHGRLHRSTIPTPGRC